MLYANIDGFCPDSIAEPGQLDAAALSRGTGYRPVAERGELDHWVLSELNQTLDFVVRAMDDYDNFGACNRIYRWTHLIKMNLIQKESNL